MSQLYALQNDIDKRHWITEWQKTVLNGFNIRVY